MTPISPKVSASAVTAFIVSLLTTHILVGADASVVEAFVSPLVVAAGTFAAGWLAKHRDV